MKKCTIFITSIIILASCSTPPIEATRTFNNHENFNIKTNAEVEFIQDSVEYLQFYGNANMPPVHMWKAEDTTYNWQSQPISFLDVVGHQMPPNTILNKIEVHYIDLRRITYMHYQPPTSLGAIVKVPIYTRSPIINDSLDFFWCQEHDSVIEVNVRVLTIDGYSLKKVKFAGHANQTRLLFDATNNTNYVRYNFSQLNTDTLTLNMYSITSYSNIQQARIDVDVNSLLIIDIPTFINYPPECPTCSCEIYYTGHPTIINNNSLDSRIILVDNN